eukprot:scaffold7963_cov116-Isochrysis_galbana.AAC.7
MVGGRRRVGLVLEVTADCTRSAATVGAAANEPARGRTWSARRPETGSRASIGQQGPRRYGSLGLGF